MATSSLVWAPLITSTRGINTGGLKKWMPTTLSGLFVALATSVIGKLLVLVASIAWEGALASASENTFFFRSMFSGTASIIKSTFLTASATDSDVFIRPMTSPTFSLLIVPLSANLSRLHLILSRALLSKSWATSTITTS